MASSNELQSASLFIIKYNAAKGRLFVSWELRLKGSFKWVGGAFKAEERYDPALPVKWEVAEEIGYWEDDVIGDHEFGAGNRTVIEIK